ncbi:hypothetical protein GQ600_9748 [Phytophthora cactorum]|nr:hypothetical protein GQ600_9748 [Phytophthora cactorum]
MYSDKRSRVLLQTLQRRARRARRRLLPLPLRRRSPTGTPNWVHQPGSACCEPTSCHQATMQAARQARPAPCIMGPSALHQLFGWMERIVKNNLPLNFCESEEAQTRSDCVETLCRSLRKVTRAVEASSLPRCLTNLDGWTLRPVIRQETRWSSTFMMLDRYFKLLEFVKDDADLEDALPTRTENPDLKALHAELTNVESVTKALQSTKVSMADTRLLFDGLIPLRASFAKYLGKRAEIVYAADFEAACVKIQEGRAHQLSVHRKRCQPTSSIGATSDGAQAAAKRRKTTALVVTKRSLSWALEERT